MSIGMEHLGAPFALYDLPVAAQVEAMAWWFARQHRESPPREHKSSGDPELDAFLAQLERE